MTHCPECGGDGWIEEEYQAGGYTPDRWVEIRVRQVECWRCEGTGEQVELEDDE